MNGGRNWFAVESKSFEIILEEVRGKLIGSICERSKGFSSWIKFGDSSLGLLLARMETCYRIDGRKLCTKS